MKSRTQTFRTKLWLYFVLFAAVIFSLLWILQTVGLQRFYDGMMMDNIRKAGQEIAANSRNDDLTDLIDRLSVENSLLVYITDADGDVYYSSDAYQPYFRQSEKPMFPGGLRRNPDQRRDDTGKGPQGGYRNLPDGYDDFLSRINASETGTVEYPLNNSYIYGTRIILDEDDDDDDDKTETAVLFVSGTLGAVGAAASIIRVQLLWVTGLSLIIAFVIAWLISRRFSVPISQLSAQAKMLSEDHYEDHFKKGFCQELDDLNDSLTQSAEKLAEARDYQKELLANVSHDLRTPLTMIKGYTEMLRDISWSDEDQRNADAGVILREADRMTALVNDILNYSRLQEKDREIPFTDVDLSALTESVAARFEPLFRREGGTIERKIAPGCIVRGNADLLERAVFNLIDNAVRHADEDDKRITVTVSRENRVVLTVRDYGEGIDPAELPHIWEKYYTHRQRGSKGVSGLGLAIVRQIALIHNAEVGVESQKDRGSCFTFTI